MNPSTMRLQLGAPPRGARDAEVPATPLGRAKSGGLLLLPSLRPDPSAAPAGPAHHTQAD
jgi:hypothetical protein